MINGDMLTSVFVKCRDTFRVMAAGIVGSVEADDVIHDAFCRLWTSQREFGSEAEAARLGYTAVRNQAIDRYRRSAARPVVDVDEANTMADPATSETEAEQERRELYRRVIELSRERLPERQFEVFRLKDVEGMDFDEVAQVMGMTPENVRVTLSRARKSIRALFRSTN